MEDIRARFGPWWHWAYGLAQSDLGQLGFDVIGGAEGMIEGFRAIFPLV